MKTPPILETDRLILKVPTLEIAHKLQSIANNKNVTKYLSQLPYPYTFDDATTFIKRCHDDFFIENGEQNFGIFLKNNDTLIGMAGLDLTTHHNHSTLGYWLGEDYWGKGYATELAKRLVRYGFEELQLYRVACAHFHTNPASGHVMKKAGLTHEGTRRGHFKRDGQYLDILDYGVLKEEYKAL